MREGLSMEYKYLSSIPKPLLNDFVNNRVIPFVGAGFSKNADIPAGRSMHDWNEIGKLVAAEITGYDYGNTWMTGIVSLWKSFFHGQKNFQRKSVKLKYWWLQSSRLKMSRYSLFCVYESMKLFL